jgi:hypothetical protein
MTPIVSEDRPVDQMADHYRIDCIQPISAIAT